MLFISMLVAYVVVRHLLSPTKRSTMRIASPMVVEGRLVMRCGCIIEPRRVNACQAHSVMAEVAQK